MLIHRSPSIPTWTSAFKELDDMRRDMGRLFNVFSDYAGFGTAGVFPAMNVSETPDALLVRAELPGIERKDLEVNVENNTLTVAGERRMPHENEEGTSYHRREREWGKFRRSFTLPCRVDADRVEARYNQGILTVTLPKAAEARPRQITVHAGQ